MRTALGVGGLVAGALLIVAAFAPGPSAPLPEPPSTVIAPAPALPPVERIAPAIARGNVRSAPTELGEGWRVAIERLGIDLPLRAGDIERDLVKQATPEGAAFLLPGSAVPGTGDNAYIYAHARKGMFLPLWDARVGDLVVVSRGAAAPLRYVVSEIHPRVPADDLASAQPTGDERLTLQTSTGPRAADPRFVVVALPDR